MGFTNYLKNKIADSLFGSQLYFPSSTLSFALSTGIPVSDGSNFLEPSGFDYSRINIDNNKTVWSVASNGALTNNIGVSFGPATGNWGTISHVGIYSGSDLILYDSIYNPRTITSGDSISFPSGSININNDNNFNILLNFLSSTTDFDAGVVGVVGSPDPNISFAFDEISPRIGLPFDLEISESTVLKLVITFPSDYSGKEYRYTDSSGTIHDDIFPSTNSVRDY